MLVYGDPARTLDPRAVLEELGQDLAVLDALPPGLERHGALVSVFILAGELLQSLADAEYEARGGVDAGSPVQDAAMALLLDLARAVDASWSGGFAAGAPSAGMPLAALAVQPLPAAVRLKKPEGYAFYALYPEAYLEAARMLDLNGPPRVIGIRSIGTGLAALAAVALGAPPPVTVRPGGHPFQRTLSLADDLAAALLDAPDAHYVVVDEGPGLSGSSFGAVADWLEEGGVAPGRIAFLPGHGGDLGPQASPRHRERWARAQRPVADFDALFRAESSARRLERWAADLVGQPVAPPEDLSGGAWRALRFEEGDWPAANAQAERRKVLVRTERGAFLVKFAGLGREGADKLARARALHAAGFVPEPLGLRHGVLVERWIEDGQPLDPSGPERRRFLAHLARYLAFRASRFPAGPDDGAPPDALLAMARHNAAQALGEEAARPLDAWTPRLAALAARTRRVHTDNRLQAWEWLALPDGSFIKTDALDHSAAHDLVGCQDMAWDIAGAGVAFALGAHERETLREAVSSALGRPVDTDLVAFLTPCYLAFQLGSDTLAASALTGWPDEATRLTRRAEGYAKRLRESLGTMATHSSPLPACGLTSPRVRGEGFACGPAGEASAASAERG